MGAPERIALQGSTRGLSSFLLLYLLFHTTISGIAAEPPGGHDACRDPIARVVSIQGTVEVQAAGQDAWKRVARLDIPLCSGDKLRTGSNGRSALFVQPESLVRVDRHTTLALSQLPDETLIEFFQDTSQAVGADSCGAAYFISRFPRKLRINAPHHNAAVEGTEFLVALACISDQVSVFEGKVRVSQLSDASRSVLLESGQTATIGPGEAPAKLNIRPEDAVQWVVYYPPLTPSGTAIAEDCRSLPAEQRARCLIARAEALLRTGEVAEAKAQIADALHIAPESSDGKALLSIISLVRNEKAEALRLAGEATTAAPASAPAWLALSYAQQADFKLEAALVSARKAAGLDTSSAIAWARVAELELSLGYNREAERTARKAVDLNPSESRAHMILGFVHLAQIEVKEARADFERAIELDSTEPLSRLGLGLAIIRKGNLKEGREQIEIAVALDPTNSLLRSYVGKAYYEENTRERDRLAASQYGLAKQLDPNDPTPWYYDSILKQARNQPIDSLENSTKSKELNEKRQLQRSRLLLDEDNAARSVNLARAYGDLGFDQLGLREAASALDSDPTSSSAHRFLAETYAAIPRHDIARESELLQAQLRQPLTSNPNTLLKTQDGISSLLPKAGFPRALGVPHTGMNEYDRLFDRNGLALYADGLVGEQDTWGDQVAVSGLSNRTSFSAAQARFETNGFGPHKNLSQDAYDLFLQHALSSGTNLQAEYLAVDTDRQDIILPFDPVDDDPVRQVDKMRRFRVGLAQELGPNSQLILSGARQTLDANFILLEQDANALFDFEASTIEAQYVTRWKSFSLVAGAGFLTGDTDFQPFLSGTPLGSGESESTHSNGYLYGHYTSAGDQVDVDVGLSYDDFGEGELNIHQLNPKLGIGIRPFQGTSLHAAALRSLKRPYIGQQTIEPTQIAGFNQFFSDINGTGAEQYSAQIDQRLGPSSNVGISGTQRNLTTHLSLGGVDETFDWTERLSSVYWYWVSSRHPDASGLSRWRWALSVQLQREYFYRPAEYAGNEGILNLDTRSLPIALTAFPIELLSVRLVPTYVKQTGLMQSSFFSNASEIDEDFWILDLSMTYKMTPRNGIFSVGANNLFDKKLRFQEMDTANPRWASGRFAFARIQLNF